MSASSSELVTMNSRSARLSWSRWILRSPALDGWKYDRTRLRRLTAFPTYMTRPSASRMMYTPGWHGNWAARAASSLMSAMPLCPKRASSASMLRHYSR